MVGTEQVMTAQKRDWTRPLSWGLAGYAFGAITVMVNDQSVRSPSDVFSYSLVIAVAWGILWMVLGAAKTVFSKKPAGILIPFVTASFPRSILFVISFAFGMLIKSFIFGLGTIGVIIVIVMGFVTLGVIWPSAKPSV